jgi:hypothetical protein
MLKFKIIGLALALVLIAALVAVASGATGAYFSDTEAGTISGTMGSIKIDAGVNADFGGGMNFGFTNLLPGEPQSGTVHYINTGRSAQDVYIVFPDADALHALNDLGTFGSVTIEAPAVSWHSDNLTDFYPSGTPGNPGVATLYHVPSQMLLQSDVAPGEGGSMTFTFAYAGKLPNSDGPIVFNGPEAAWNPYPLPAISNSHNGYTYNPPSGIAPLSLNGLPYQIVACQRGQTPNALVHPPLTPTPSWY